MYKFDLLVPYLPMASAAAATAAAAAAATAVAAATATATAAGELLQVYDALSAMHIRMSYLHKRSTWTLISVCLFLW